MPPYTCHQVGSIGAHCVSCVVSAMDAHRRSPSHRGSSAGGSVRVVSHEGSNPDRKDGSDDESVASTDPDTYQQERPNSWINYASEHRKAKANTAELMKKFEPLLLGLVCSESFDFVKKHTGPQSEPGIPKGAVLHFDLRVASSSCRIVSLTTIRCRCWIVSCPPVCDCTRACTECPNGLFWCA